MQLLNVEFFIVITAFIGNGFLGLFTYLKNPKSNSNRFFFLFTFALGLYLFLNYSATHQTSDQMTLLFIRTVMTLGLIINLLFLLLTSTFPFSKLQLPPKAAWVLSLITLLLLPATQTSLIFQSLKPNTVEPVPGPGMPLFLLHTAVFIGLGLFFLAKKFRKSTGVVKTQLRLFLLGALLMFGAILITNIILVVLFHNSSLVNLLPIYTLIFVGFISYAIVRHKFLDINLIVARTVSYTLVIIVTAFVYSLLIFAIGQLLFGLNPSREELTVLVVVTVAISMSFQRVKNLVNKLTNKFFFKSNYDTDQVLQGLTRIMAATLQLDTLTHQLLRSLLKSAHITKGAFILMENKSITEVICENLSEFNPTIEQVNTLIEARGINVFDELEEGRIKNTMRSLDISISVELISENTLIGILVLGQKESGDIYSEQDLSLLKILASEAAIAIQNAQSYEKIRRFNITLQEEINKATADLKEANLKLQQVDKLKDEFVSLASHELRTPMTAIKSYVWMVQNAKAGPITDTTQKYLDIVYSSTERLIHLVNDMLDISRIESGRFQLHPESFNFADLVHEVQTEFSAKAGERKMTWQTSIDPAEIIVLADKDKILQVLENLVGNAFKFTPDGGSVTLSASVKSNSLVVAITDSGRGISQEDIPKLFTKFTRLGEGLPSLAQPGTGLGLYLSKQYVELHHGQVSVDSIVDRGSTFTFTIPLS